MSAIRYKVVATGKLDVPQMLFQSSMSAIRYKVAVQAIVGGILYVRFNPL